jgi:acetyltransferase-like isoleucine patch superfamily enzyme
VSWYVNPSTEIRIPREIVNDDVVKIAAWEVADGAKVQAKQVVVAIETSKAVIDLEAETDGYLEILHPKGAELPVGELIGRVQAQPVAKTQKPVSTASEASIGGNGAHASAAGLRISKKAQALIEQHAIDPGVFAGTHLVRESDVLAYVERQKVEPVVGTAVLEAASAGTKPESVPGDRMVRSKPGSPAVLEKKRGFLHDARVSASDRGGKGLFALAVNYLWRNWFLGNLVRWAPRGVILPLHRLRGVKIGKDCYIDPNAIIETAYPENITIGNDVRVTARAIIMTHIKAPHYLRESGIMPVVLKPVVLEDHSFIGVNSVIMPGVTVGKASVVASGAVVLTNVPPYTMVAGNPAKVVKTFPRPQEEM